MEKMTLDDIMNILAGWGAVRLSRTRFPVTASKELVGKPVQWRCHLSIPGYEGPHGRPMVETSRDKQLEAAQECYDMALAYLSSPEARLDRARYVEEYGRRKSWYESAIDPKITRHGTIRNPGPLLPDVYCKDTVSIDKETIR